MADRVCSLFQYFNDVNDGTAEIERDKIKIDPTEVEYGKAKRLQKWKKKKLNCAVVM